MNRPVWLTLFGAGILAAAAGGIVALDRSALLREGTPAPDFTARLSSGEEITLSRYRGKRSVVLSFYPADFTPGCTKQACSYRDHHGEIERLGAVLLGVSADGPARHAEFIRVHGLPYPLISDPERNILRLYGAERFGGGILPARRVTYVIDAEGVIRLAAHHELLVGRHIREILKTLRSLPKPS